ncbi:hypothetical protein AAK706_07410 [Erysipelotrichaceae bacterium 66-17]
MSVKIGANSKAPRYVPEVDQIAPKATNFTPTAGPKISASEATLIKWGPLCVISFIAKATEVIAVGETIFNLPVASSATFAIGIFGSGAQHGARVTGSKIEAINAIPANEWIRGQIIYPSAW